MGNLDRKNKSMGNLYRFLPKKQKNKSKKF